MSAETPSGEIPKGCAIRIIAVFMVTALALAWYAADVDRQSTSELDRCVSESSSAARESAKRAELIRSTLDSLAAGKLQAPDALQRLEDVRAASESMATVLSKSSEAGRCATEARPVLALLRTEERARSHGAESASALIRAQQKLQEVRRLSAEAEDYQGRYQSLRQIHLLTLARDFRKRASKSRGQVSVLKKTAVKERQAMDAALREHKRLLRSII